MADIDAQRLAQYRRDGYIVVEGLLDDVTRQRMKQVLAELIEGARAVSHARRRLRPRADAQRRAATRAPHQEAAPRASGVRRVHALAAAARRAERAARPERRAAARLEAQPEGARDRLAGGMASGLGLLSAHQRRPAGRRRAARRCHRAERSDDGAAGQPPRSDLRPPRVRRPLLRRDGAGARRPRLPARAGPDRAGRVLLVPPRARGARLGPEHARRTRATCCSTSSPRPMPFRCSASPTGTSSTPGCWSASRPSCRAPSIARSACRCRRRRTRARSTRTRRRCSAATSNRRRLAAPRQST